MSKTKKPSLSSFQIRFLQAVKQGDVAHVRTLLAEDQSLLRLLDPDEFNAPPLNLAVSRSDQEMVEALLDAGADPNQKSDWWAGGFAALHVLPWAERESLAKLLLKRGAKLDAHAAAYLDRLEELEDMLNDDPALVHARGGDGATPLHVAGSPRVADLLLQRGTDLEERDVDHGGTPAQWAVDKRPAVCRLLLERGAKGDVFMYCALGDLERLEAELSQRPDLVRERITDEQFTSPGSEGGHIYMHSLGESATPLHVAAMQDRTQVAERLLLAGADVNAAGGYDDATPLHFCAFHGHTTTAALLLDHGADIERPSGAKHGNTPLGWAIVGGNPGVARALLQRGAAILPHHHKDCASGAKGAFRAINGKSPDIYEELERVLTPEAKGTD